MLSQIRMINQEDMVLGTKRKQGINLGKKKIKMEQFIESANTQS